MSFFLRSISQSNTVVRTLSALANPSRGVSRQVAFDNYFAPYPDLPKVNEPKNIPGDTPSPTTTGKEFYKELVSIGEASERSPEERWASVYDVATRNGSRPGNVYTGRSVAVPDKGHDLSVAYRRLHMILSRNHVRSELFLQRRYEKPSDRERRLKSERHRRRFAAWIRKKVQLVSEIRRRG